MKGAELIKWIQDNHAEDWPVIALSPENGYLRVKPRCENQSIFLQNHIIHDQNMSWRQS